MTIWSPELQDRSGPVYRSIADALAKDIEQGRLTIGQRLPTHRDLARRLGVTIGTIVANEPDSAGTTAKFPFFTVWRRDGVEEPWRYVAE